MCTYGYVKQMHGENMFIGKAELAVRWLQLLYKAGLQTIHVFSNAKRLLWPPEHDRYSCTNNTVIVQLKK